MQYKRSYAPYLIVAVMFAAWLLQACNGGNRRQENTRPPEEDSVQVVNPAPTAKDTVRSWTDLKLMNWKSWVDSSTAGQFAPNTLQRTTVETITAADTITMEEERFEQFKPFFVYSPDSSQVVDMVSYGNFIHKGHNGKVVLEEGEPDTEVAIVNVQTKKRERILFAGPSTVVREVVWINDHTILIAGGTYDDQNRLQPLIWKYDTVNKQLENWEAE